MGLPAVERDGAVGAYDVVVLVGGLGIREESRAGESLRCGLVLAELPVEVPLQERRNPVVVLEVRLQIALNLWIFGRHSGGRTEKENESLREYVGSCD